MITYQEPTGSPSLALTARFGAEGKTNLIAPNSGRYFRSSLSHRPAHGCWVCIRVYRYVCVRACECAVCVRACILERASACMHGRARACAKASLCVHARACVRTWLYVCVRLRARERLRSRFCEAAGGYDGRYVPDRMSPRDPKSWSKMHVAVCSEYQ
jgi:hypothetical protein